MRAKVALAAIALAGAAARAAGPPPQSDLVTPEIRSAIEVGLGYLVKMQQPDGSFPAKWDSKAYPAAMTSLSGLALLASGSTPAEGQYAESIKKAMVYLLEVGEAHPDGLIAGPREQRCTYGHGFAMTFLAQCYGMEPTPQYEQRIKRALHRAISLVARGQSRLGGWLYSPMGAGDEGSTTASVLQGLRACRNVGLKVPKTTIDKAVEYLRHCQNPDGGICYSAAHRGSSRPTISAAAVTCFYSAGVYDRVTGGEQDAESLMVEKLWRYLKVATRNVEDIEGFYFYHNFYLAQAMYQRSGAEWETYYKQIARELLKRRSANGTWTGDDIGPVYATAIGCFILQLPYNYLPIVQR